MILKPTVLVLGAGVSHDYGYPLGSELMEKVSALENDPGFHVLLSRFTPPLNNLTHCVKFCYQLRNCGLPSIDIFLERNPEYIQLGKLAIAYILLGCENESIITDNMGTNIGCYKKIWQCIETSWDELTKNNISIITFNYDRSLEYYLFIAMKATYGKSDKEITSAINGINIIHVHGWVGPFDWQDTAGRPYRTVIIKDDINNAGLMIANCKLVRKASERIIIMSESQVTSDEFVKAQSFLESAYRIFFVGFGYHEVNLSRLRIQNFKYSDSRIILIQDGTYFLKEIIGSAYKIGLAKRKSITETWGISIPGNTKNAVQFLEDHCQLD